jgi:hypothetical protein
MREVGYRPLGDLTERYIAVDTIANTDALQLASVAELMHRLFQSGVTQTHLERALQYPGMVREMSDVLRAPSLVVPRRLPPQKREEFVLNLFPASYDDNGVCKSNATFPLYGDERAWLTQIPQVHYLLSRLTRQQLLVVLERSGLDGRRALNNEEAGDKLCMPPNRVNRIRTQARRTMVEEAIKLCKRARSGWGFQLPTVDHKPR